MTDERANATAEIAKAAGEAVDAVRELGSFVARYVGGPFEQTSGIVEDKLKYLRWERQVRLMARADAFLAERGLSRPSMQVPLSFAIPLLQAGSVADNDELQDLWAALLVNAADADSGVEVRRAFISILEDLTPLDAFILDKIYSLPYGPEPNADLMQEIWTTELPEKVTIEKRSAFDRRPPLDCEIAIGNLARLGLLTSAIALGGMAMFSCVHRTMLGREFHRACQRTANTAVRHGIGRS